MNSILEIPDDSSEIGKWIESILLSENFLNLIGQLKAVNDLESDQDTPVDPPSDAKLAEIAAKGTLNVSLNDCQALLRNPQSLVDLQDRIFEVGSRYWLDQIKTAPTESQTLAQFSQDIFQPGQGESETVSPVSKPIEKGDLRNNSGAPSSGGLSRRGVFSLALTLLGLGLSCYFVLQMTQSDNRTQWGWQSAHAMAEPSNANEYLTSLSKSGLEWFDQKRDTRDLLAARLEEFSAGCQRLIGAPHNALSETDRDWLLEKCKTWKTKIDELAAATRSLNSNTDAQQQTLKNEADDLASKIGLALSERAKSI